MILFVLLLGLTAFCSYRKDDDVVYDFLDRKPTPRESIIRIRWVLLKALTSIVGGGVLALSILMLVMKFNFIFPSKNAGILLGAICMGVVNLSIGLLQNVIRWLTGRTRRPVFDRVIWRKNLRQWSGKW